MSQHDFDIANQTASNARVDINLALKALGSLSSGSTAPTTTYANMLWYDTSATILKMRSEADDAWISMGYLHQGENQFHILDDTYVSDTSGNHVGLLGDQSTATWQAGTSTTESLVSPAKVKALAEINNPIKAWVNFNGTGTVAIRDSLNVASVTDNGAGDYTINFSSPLSSSNYAPLITVAGVDPNRSGVVAGDASNVPLLKTVNSLRIRTGIASTGTFADLPDIYVAIFN